MIMLINNLRYAFLLNILVYKLFDTYAFSLPIPSSAQLRWANDGYGAFIHFNMNTFLPGDDKCANWDGLARNADTFNPTSLDTDNWLKYVKSYGAKYVVLTVKHGCGFVLYPSNITLPNGQRFNYSVAFSKWRDGKGDVVADFLASCQKFGVRPGFYFSLSSSAFFNVKGNKVQPGPIKAGQYRVTQEQYEQITIDMLNELWSIYGTGNNISEVWFDGGYADSIKNRLQNILNQTLPHTVALNGFGITPNPVRWIANEKGHAPVENWDTGACDAGQPGGDRHHPGGLVNSTDFCPSECPYTMQIDDTWFWNHNGSIHTMEELKAMFHATVGHNCNPIFDFAPTPDGIIAPYQAQRYVEFGNWIRSCYGTPIVETNGSASILTVNILSPKIVDRVFLQEDLKYGQRVRNWEIQVPQETIFLLHQLNGIDNCSIVQGKILGTKTIGESLHVPTADACCTLCRQTSGCVAFTWAINGTHSCFLKSNSNWLKDQDDRISGVLQSNCTDGWCTVGKGTSIGAHYIQMLSPPIQPTGSVTKLRLIISESVGTPMIKRFASFSNCDKL